MDRESNLEFAEWFEVLTLLDQKKFIKKVQY